MDIFFDDDMIKVMKPLILGIIGLSALYGISMGIEKFTKDDQQSQKEEQQFRGNKQNKRKKPAGIFNQGNTCFVNSLLQALGSLKQFIENLDQIISKFENKLSYDERLLLQLRHALRKINQGTESVDISSFLEVLSENSGLINLEQQDAYELYSVILVSFQRVVNRQKIQSLSKSFRQQDRDTGTTLRNSLEMEYEQCSINQEKQYCSLLGYTKSSIKCHKCQVQKNIKIHPFYDISFDISSITVQTIQSAFGKFQQTELINGWICSNCSIQKHIQKLQHHSDQIHNQYINNPKNTDSELKEQAEMLINVAKDIIYFCQHNLKDDELEITDMNEQLSEYISKYMTEYTKLSKNKFRDKIFVEINEVKTTILKSTVITKFPKILVIHLKQLSFNQFTGQPILLRKFIDFQEHLSIPIRNGSKKYTLSSLLSHVGNQSMGHYYTYRKMNSSEQQWYFLSDTLNKQCDWYDLKKSLPYMLFYQISEEDHRIKIQQRQR